MKTIKQYIKPAIEVTNCEPVCPIAASLSFDYEPTDTMNAPEMETLWILSEE